MINSLRYRWVRKDIALVGMSCSRWFILAIDTDTLI